MQQGTPAYLAASKMLECVRTGEPAAESVLGLPLFEYLAQDPERSEIFNRAMAGGARASVAAAMEYDWSQASVVVDIGGGSGSLLSAVLAANPHLRGVVFDLPQVALQARPVIEARASPTAARSWAGTSSQTRCLAPTSTSSRAFSTTGTTRRR